MKSFRKKVTFLDLVLLYVIVLLAVTGNGGRITESVSRAAAQVMGDRGEGERIDPYQEVKKKVAITFDDGPDPDYTPVLLDGLKERQVKATFFLLGRQTEQYPEIVKRMYEEGHLIGTHSYEHVNLKKLSDKKAVEQVNRTNQLIYEITGECPQYIRPPFGSWKSNLDYETTMIEVLWDIDPLDWNNSNSIAIVKKVVTRVQEYDIILMHDASESSVNAAFKIIDELEKNGYEFVTVEEILME